MRPAVGPFRRVLPSSLKSLSNSSPRLPRKGESGCNCYPGLTIPTARLKRDPRARSFSARARDTLFGPTPIFENSHKGHPPAGPRLFATEAAPAAFPRRATGSRPLSPPMRPWPALAEKLGLSPERARQRSWRRSRQPARSFARAKLPTSKTTTTRQAAAQVGSSRSANSTLARRRALARSTELLGRGALWGEPDSLRDPGGDRGNRHTGGKTSQEVLATSKGATLRQAAAQVGSVTKLARHCLPWVVRAD